MKKYGIFLNGRKIDEVEAEEHFEAVKKADSAGYIITKYDIKEIPNKAKKAVTKVPEIILHIPLYSMNGNGRRVPMHPEAVAAAIDFFKTSVSDVEGFSVHEVEIGETEV